MKILNSASRIVFIMMAIGVNAALFTKFINAEQYITLASLSFAFYFAKPVVPNTSTTTSTTHNESNEK